MASDVEQSPGDEAPRRRVSPEHYCELLRRLAQAARALNPMPDAVVGMKRSGLFPAVYISHQLDLPMFTGPDVDSFPYPRLKHPLLVDTTAWNGRSLRRVISRLERRGVPEVKVLVMFARVDPPPNVRGLHCLEHNKSIVHFWYEDEQDSLC